MELPYLELPGQPVGYLRPTVAVRLGGQEAVAHLCLLDSGALHNRFGSWVAEAAGIELPAELPETAALGGVLTRAASVPVDLRIGAHAWRAPVWFCDPWPFSFNLLGQEGFFRFFTVTFRAAHSTVALEPELGPPA